MPRKPDVAAVGEISEVGPLYGAEACFPATRLDHDCRCGERRVVQYQERVARGGSEAGEPFGRFPALLFRQDRSTGLPNPLDAFGRGIADQFVARPQKRGKRRGKRMRSKEAVLLFGYRYDMKSGALRCYCGQRTVPAGPQEIDSSRMFLRRRFVGGAHVRIVAARAE